MTPHLITGKTVSFRVQCTSFSRQKVTQIKTSSFLWRRICVPFFPMAATLSCLTVSSFRFRQILNSFVQPTHSGVLPLLLPGGIPYKLCPGRTVPHQTHSPSVILYKMSWSLYTLPLSSPASLQRDFAPCSGNRGMHPEMPDSSWSVPLQIRTLSSAVFSYPSCGSATGLSSCLNFSLRFPIRQVSLSASGLWNIWYYLPLQQSRLPCPTLHWSVRLLPESVPSLFLPHAPLHHAISDWFHLLRFLRYPMEMVPLYFEAIPVSYLTDAYAASWSGRNFWNVS